MTANQIDRLLNILTRFVKVAERWADVEYPERDEEVQAEIYRRGEQPLPDSKEAYEALEVPGRFESKLRS
jgi:hypothetical protein